MTFRFFQLLSNPDIITTPQNFAEIAEADDKSITYEVSLSFDIERVLSRNCQNLEIVFSKNRKRRDFSPTRNTIVSSQRGTFQSLTGFSFINNLQLQNQKIQRSRLQAKVDFFARANANLTDFLDDRLYRSFFNARTRNQFINTLPFRRKFRLSRAKNISDRPVRVKQKSGGRRSRRSRNTFRASGLRSLLGKRSHSSDAIRSSRGPSFGKNVNRGVSNKRSGLSNTSNSEMSYGNSREANNIRARLIPPFKNVFSSNALRPNAFVQVPFLSRNPRKTISKRVKISREYSDKLVEFFVTFKLKNKSGVTIAEIERKVNHQKNLRALLEPLVPPKIRAAAGRQQGVNMLYIKQLDPRGRSVSIYKKTVSSNPFDRSKRGYEKVTSLKLTPEMGSIKIKDVTSTAKTIVYRAIPAMGNGETSSTFSTFVMPPRKNNRSSQKDRSLNISLITSNDQENIKISVTNIIDDPCSLQVVRKDLTKSETKFTPISAGRLRIRQASPGQVYEVVDSQVKRGHIYEYGCFLTFRTGQYLLGNDKSVIERQPLTNGIAEIAISDVSIANNTNQPNVTFSLESSITENKTDEVRALLEKQGLTDLFSDIEALTRSELSGIIAHQITRINISTGDEESFGVITEEKFDDNKLGSTRGIKPLQPGSSYRYVIQTLLRRPEEVVPGFIKTQRSQNGLEYIFSPAKYFNPFSKRTGTAVSGGEPKSISKSQLALGGLSNFTELSIEIPESPPRVVEVTAERFSKSTVLLKWSISGRNQDIDYFVLSEIQYGNSKVIDVAHALEDNTRFEYLTKINANDPAAISYSVTAVLNDGNETVVAESNQIVVDES